MGCRAIQCPVLWLGGGGCQNVQGIAENEGMQDSLCCRLVNYGHVMFGTLDMNVSGGSRYENIASLWHLVKALKL